MLLHLANGQTRTLPMGSATMGLSLTGVTFHYDDILELLKSDPVAITVYLGILSTRFDPLTIHTTVQGEQNDQTS